LAHKTSLLPPPCDLAVHKIEKQTERDKAQGEVEVRVVMRVILYAIAQRGKDRHHTTEAHTVVGGCRTVELSNEIGEMEGADEREVTSILRE
jgi:hypothetical protein